MSTMGKRDFRPSIHFSPEKGWMNDPNGMVYVNGTYHFFYQKYPYASNWGPMHWGHAVSRDLLHWEHYPIALYPDELGVIFSGSAVYDRMNSSEFGTKEHPPIVAIYTNHDATGMEMQSVAYSIDGGHHFEKSYLNPVIPNPGIDDFRDPKAFWNPIDHCWGLVLAAQDRVHFYASNDLKNWEKTGEFGPEGNHASGVWECPDLFPVKYKDQVIWVLVVSMTKGSEDDCCKMQYFLGDFDGKKFICTYPADEVLYLDNGYDNYAAVTFQNFDEPLMMGWAMNWAYAGQTPTNEYCGQATLARKLRIVETEKGLRLASRPIGLDKYQNRAFPVESGKHLYTETFGIRVKGKGEAKLVLRNSVGQKLKIRVKDGKISVDRSLAGERSFNERFMTPFYSEAHTREGIGEEWDFEMIFDVSVLELFASQGRETITMVMYPDTPYDRITWEGDLNVELYEIGK